MESRHLYIQFVRQDENEFEIIATGDTFGAKDILKKQGWKYRSPYGQTKGIDDKIVNVLKKCTGTMKPEWYKRGTKEEVVHALMQLAELVPDDVEYLRQWSLEVNFGNGKIGLFLINAGQLIPAKRQHGRIIKA